MSLRRPTVAHLLFIIKISPFCDVAQTSDCGISFIGPFCDVAQTFDCGISFISHLCGVAQTPDCGMSFICLPFEASLQTPDRFSVICFTFQVVQPLYYWSEHHYFCSWRIHACICYIFCPNCLASTFKVLTWLVDLARSWWRRSHGWRVR